MCEILICPCDYNISIGEYHTEARVYWVQCTSEHAFWCDTLWSDIYILCIYNAKCSYYLWWAQLPYIANISEEHGGCVCGEGSVIIHNIYGTENRIWGMLISCMRMTYMYLLSLIGHQQRGFCHSQWRTLVKVKMEQFNSKHSNAEWYGTFLSLLTQKFSLCIFRKLVKSFPEVPDCRVVFKIAIRIYHVLQRGIHMWTVDSMQGKSSDGANIIGSIQCHDLHHVFYCDICTKTQSLHVYLVHPCIYRAFCHYTYTSVQGSK